MSLTLVPPRKDKTRFWYVRGTFAGRTIDASTKATNKKAAQEFKEQLERELAKQDAHTHGPATFAMAAELYLGFRNPSKPMRKAVARLVTLLGNHLLSEIKQHTLIDAANKLHPDAEASTKNRQVLVPALAVLHYAFKCDLCPYITVRKFKEKSPEPRALGAEQAKALIAVSDGEMRALLTFLFYQGWRISDTLRLRWADLDLQAATVRYHISKTDDWRIMPLHPATVAAFSDMKRDIGKVFHWGDKSNLYRDLRPFCARFGIKFTPHMARHSFATWLANKGVSPADIMEAGGWQDIKSVMRYAKLDPTRIRNTIDKL